MTRPSTQEAGKTTKIMILVSLFAFTLFGLFIYEHQNRLYENEVKRVKNHAKVISVSLWNYHIQTPTDYLQLATDANNYVKVTVVDEHDYPFLEIAGKTLTKTETFLSSLKLLRTHHIKATIIYGERNIGSITVDWLCRSLYLYLYIFFCIFLLLIGLFLFLKLLEANKHLERRVKHRTLALENEIQKHKRTARELEYQAQRLSMHVRNTPLGVVEWSSDFTVVDWNRAAEQIFGYRREEILGRKPFGLIVPEEEKEKVKQVWEQLLSRTGGTRNVNLYRNKEGDLKTCAWYNTPLTDNFSNVIGVGSLVLDLTEQVEAEKKNKILQEQLLQAQKMEAVGNLAGGISHDFNNLLQSISGYTQLLLLECEKKNEDCRRLRGIETAAQRAAELIRQLLTFSRKITSNLVPLNLNKEIEQVRSILDRTIPKMVSIRMDLAPDLYDIKGDSVQIEQVLLNLAINASHAMEDGGTLFISTKNSHLDSYYCASHLGAQPGWNVTLTVEDTGVGMDEATLEHIFEPFFTTKEIGKGSGLGLASVYGIVIEHRAYIECTSEPEKGARFTIHFPALFDQDQRGVNDHGTHPDHIPRGTETVLIVDDEETIREIGQQMLEDYGYTALTASNAEEALQIYSARKDEIDLVVMDLNMPGMGGYKCTKALKEITPELLIVVASGYTPTETIAMCKDAGATGFISKPFDLTELLSKIRQVLDHRG